MSEMIERVARKLQEMGAVFPASPMTFEQTQMAALPGGNWRRYESPARALIEAVREPTEAMVQVYHSRCHIGGDLTEQGDEPGGYPFDAISPLVIATWRAMIDEALR